MEPASSKRPVSGSQPGVVMVLDSVFPTAGGGGAEFQVKTLAKRLLADGVPVLVVVPRVTYGPQSAEDMVEGIPVRRIVYPHIRGIGSLIMLIKLAWLLIRERHNYPAIHAHVARNMAAVSSLVGLLSGRRVVVKLTGLLEMQHGILSNRHGQTTLLRIAIRRATWVQATSSRIQRMLLYRGFSPRQVVAIPNAVDTERFTPQGPTAGIRSLLNLSPDARVVIYAGRLVDEKGLDVLIKAWADALSRTTDMHLVMIGSGNLEAQLSGLIKQHGLSGNIHLLGARNQLELFYRDADMGVLPSLHEGLSNTLLEYMACGLPVIGSRVSGTEDYVIDGQTGWLFEPGDSITLAEALTAAAATSKPELTKLGRTARTRIVAAASIDNVTARLCELYGCTLQPQSQPASDSRRAQV